jgi:hypothetical protein
VREWFRAAWKIAAGTVAEYRRPRGAMLDELAARLGIESRHNEVSVTRHGVPVVLRFGARGSGSDAMPWTEVEGELPPSYPLEIHVERRIRFETPRGAAAADVGLGVPAFDGEFLVEIAPVDIARILLDAGARRMLSVHHRVELNTTSQGGRRLLRLEIQTWIEDVSDAMFAIDRVARICAGVRNAYALLDRAAPVQMEGAPYRPMPNDESAREASDERALEVAALQTLRAQRKHRDAVLVTVALVVAGLCWLASLI